MNKLKSMLYGVCALCLATIATSSLSAAENWRINDPLGIGGAGAEHGGPYIAIQGSANGGVMSGSGENSNSEYIEGTVGTIFGGAGLQVGWALPLADSFLLGLDIHYSPVSGEIEVDAGAGDAVADSMDVKVKVSELINLTIMPMIPISETSAFYIKLGWARADLTWSGDVETDLNNVLQGESAAIGIRTLLGEHGFIQTEFGGTDYKGFDNHTRTSGTNFNVSPQNVYGSLAIGAKY